MTVTSESELLLLTESGDSLVTESYVGPATSSPKRVSSGMVQMRTVTLTTATDEALEVRVQCSIDPTEEPPGFVLTSIGTYPTPSTVFVSGSWVGAYSDTGWTTAITPRFGSDFTITSGDRKWVWARIVAGDDAAVWLVGAVVVY